MPAASRIGDLINTGHGCDATAPIQDGSANVRVNQIGLTYRGAAIVPHTLPCDEDCCPHGAQVNAGAPAVRVNGIPASRVGDGADAGAIIQGSINVRIGNLGG